MDAARVQEIRAEMDAMIGMGPVKEQVDKLIATALVERERREQGLPLKAQRTKHIKFVGPPGTGKTTTARQIAGLYTALGVIPGTDGRVPGDLVEADRSTLVGSHLGESEEKTRKLFEKARGGVLFIDEAYSLFHGEHDMYGQQAIDVLMKLMEDHRDDTVVILAGYPKEMDRFMKSNPGLESRLPTTLNFPEFKVPELQQIMSQGMQRLEYRGEPGAKAALRAAVAEVGEGNARNVVNLQEKILQAQELRLARHLADGKPSRRDLARLKVEDVQAGVEAYRAQQLRVPAAAKPKKAAAKPRGRLVKA